MAEDSNDIRWVRDLTPAAWLSGRLYSSVDEVRSLVPDGYAAYGRLFHPVVNRTDGSTERWSDVARRHGRTVHREVQFSVIVRPTPGGPAMPPPRLEPTEGFLPIAQRRALIDVLRRHTTTPGRCWFCVSDDSGVVDDQGVTERVEVPAGPYLLHGGPIEMVLVPPPQKAGGEGRCVVFRADAMAEQIEKWAQVPTPFIQEQSPRLWWPDDRAWVVATAFGLDSTYVAGSRDLIAQLTANPEIEVLEALPGDRLVGGRGVP